VLDERDNPCPPRAALHAVLVASLLGDRRADAEVEVTDSDLTTRARAVLADPHFDANPREMLLRAVARLPTSLRDGEYITAGRHMATLRWLRDAGLVERNKWDGTDLGRECARLLAAGEVA
jgi:hypothetical protein